MSAQYNSEFKIWEWVLIFGLAVIAVVLTEREGFSQTSQNVAVYTVVVSAVVILALRPVWNRRIFWVGAIAVFTLHLLLLLSLQRMFPSTIPTLHGVIPTVGGMLEGLGIAAILWKLSMRSK